MNKKTQILEIIADIIEIDVENLTLEMELHDGLWDSLAVVTFISEIDSNFDQLIAPADVSSVKCVADLVNLVK
ncbi:acyl carrier protein [Aeromonas sp. BIGb0405]|uniref:phosphopantetheine-binding protein n=1 Tax=Aeromonas sp. BIGb0405 TaxID=2940592 RepID=UPI0021681ACA|nr:phosphopantetheine-binding protein [Aeromonas sp. BIGb0405]MCS3455399.1 acyl carrier protein [Aeromonas sp. BIGb0405]